MRAQDQIKSILDGVNAQNASKDLSDRVWVTDTGLFEGLFLVGQLTDELTDRLARFEERQRTPTQSAPIVHVQEPSPELDRLTERVARLEQGQGSAVLPSDVGAKLTDLQREIGDLRTQLTDLQKEIGDTRSRIDDTRSDVQRLTEGLARAGAQEWSAEAAAVHAPLKELQARFWALGQADNPVGLEQWAHEMQPAADEFRKWLDAHPCPDPSRAAAASQMDTDASLWGHVANSILDESLTSEGRIA
ncbi:MAG TPA: hypothetical protein VL961_05840, partial [Acidimicrobiales bacterium]|nr:hypothetical protein [Acidimicrobiales bacterium]